MEAQYESSDAANDSRDEAASVVGTWYYKDKDVTYAFAADGKYVAFVGGKEYLSGSYDVWGGEIDLRFRSSSGSLEHLLLRYKFQDGALFLGEGSASYPFVRQ